MINADENDVGVGAGSVDLDSLEASTNLINLREAVKGSSPSKGGVSDNVL